MYNKMCAVFHSINELKNLTDTRRKYVSILTQYETNPSVALTELVALDDKFNELLVGVNGVLTRNRATALGKIMLVTAITDINNKIDISFNEIQSVLDNTTSYLSANLESLNQQIDLEILTNRKAIYSGKYLAKIYMGKTIDKLLLPLIPTELATENPGVYLLNLQKYLTTVDMLNKDELTDIEARYTNFVSNVEVLSKDIDTLELAEAGWDTDFSTLKNNLDSVKGVSGDIGSLTNTELFKYLLTTRNADADINTIDILDNIIDLLPHSNTIFNVNVNNYVTYVKNNDNFAIVSKNVNDVLTERIKDDKLSNVLDVLNLSDLAIAGNYRLLDAIVNYGLLLNSKLNTYFTIVNFIDEITEKGVVK